MIKDNVLYCRASVDVPEESTGWFLYKLLMQHLDYDKCFVDEVSGEYLTYKRLLQLSCSLAEALRTVRIDPNDVIAIASENNVYFFVAVLAGLFTGNAVTTINPEYTEAEIDHALNLTQPTTVFCSKAAYKKFLQLKNKYKFIERLIVLDGDRMTSDANGLIDFIIKYKTMDTDVLSFKPKYVHSREHVAFIMFSSGTTGLPKGVMITHSNVNNRLMTQYNTKIWIKSFNSHVIGVLPFFHAFGLQMVLGYLLDGRTIHVLKQFDAVTYLTCIDKYRIEAITVVPALLLFLARHPIVDKFNLSCLKDISYGSSPASPAVIEEVTKRLGVRPRQGYGLTEVTMGITAVPPGEVKPGSVGLIYPNMQAYIRDPETGKRLGPKETGEICLKGGLVMKGYYRNEAATKEAFTVDGYLRTGDIGYYDKDGYLYIVDRMKELIKYKSFQVAPAELESVLLTHPKIKQVAVVGLPDERAGELPMAFVVKQPNVDLTENEVKSYLAKFLSKQKHLHGGVVFVDDIPVNTLGKILRKEIRKLIPKYKSKL